MFTLLDCQEDIKLESYKVEVTENINYNFYIWTYKIVVHELCMWNMSRTGFVQYFFVRIMNYFNNKILIYHDLLSLILLTYNCEMCILECLTV